MLSIPKHIEKSAIIGVPISYKWKASYQVVLIDKVPRNLVKAIHGLSCTATFSLVLGIGEWLLWRLQGMTDYQQVYHYVEALWAATIDEKYLKERELPTPKDRKEDPAYGALYGLEEELFTVTTNALLNHPERAKTAAGLVTFVRYTLPNTDAFDAWLQESLKRFADKFPYDIDNPEGVIVPRRFMELDVDLSEDSIPNMLEEQLRSIQYEQNPFLMSPNELKASGFEGEPYRFLS
jgi:hypothetical protein